MNFFRFILLVSAVSIAAISCKKADSDKPWGETLVYMPQANYVPYHVPNNGQESNLNVNWSFSKDRTELNVFLGIYRSGLAELEAYTVSVLAGDQAYSGTELLPVESYDLPSSVTCPDGKRDVTFYLSVDVGFLKENPGRVYSLPVSISNTTRYTINESLSMTYVAIDVDGILSKL